MTGPLEDVTVLDLSRHLAGPFAAMTLGDLGADVIKVEAPGRGDDTRGFPPYWNDVSCYYLSTNRNKRSVTVNLQTDEGQEIIRKIASRADVLVENFRPGTTERWGLGYADLKEINPRLIYCAISAVGSEGPDRNRAGVDLLMQAYGGLMSITGEPGRPPVRVGQSVADLTAGANAVQGILAALYVREKTGQGQRIESSLLGGQVSWMTYHAVSYFGTGSVPGRLGSGHASVAPYGAFPTRDGFLVVAVATDALWRRFCGALEREDLIERPDFARNADRCENRDELEAVLTPILAERSADEWAKRMDEAGVPCSPVNTLDTVMNLEQVAYQELVADIPRDDIPDFRMPGIAIKMQGTPGTVRLPPPHLGEHTGEILESLGYDDATVRQLRENGHV